jgi:hypothetical protein
MSSREPSNPVYLLLLVVSFTFVITALAYALVPVLEQKAADAGAPPPPSAFRDALREGGGRWLLYQLAALVVLGLLSMAVDRLLSLQKERRERTMPPSDSPPPSP